MESVLSLTYQRHNLLEEAIYSFLQQDYMGDAEMVIINDSKDVIYEIDEPRVIIYNLKERFRSVGKKLEWGLKKCKGEYVYRLDDDDLLTPWAISTQLQYRKENPNFDIYRCQYHYFFSNNIYESLNDNINNGNSYSKEFINRIEFPNTSGDEDNIITFNRGGRVYIGDIGKYSMIYRWGMGITHISSIGSTDNDIVYNEVDKFNKETGIIRLRPHFENDYYGQLPH